MSPATGDQSLPTAAYLAALAALDGAGPARLRAILAERSAHDAWFGVRSGAPWVTTALGSHDRAAQWCRAAVRIDPGELLATLRANRFGAVDQRSPGYPPPLRDDPDPPAVLFADGDLAAVGDRRVAVVGTRRCTRYGHDVAIELGESLAASGVTVVSGLALGIDAAAHVGALRAQGAPPVAVVAGGLDEPYPRRNAPLWREVAAAGVVLSEAPAGVRPQRWRFPSRNRIIAGLAEVVVVVESHERGGSLYTVSEAISRDRPVMAVPGPIRSAASTGTNALIADGGHVLSRIDDVFALLDLVGTVTVGSPHQRPIADAVDRRILDALGWQPTSIDEIVAHTRLPVDDVALRLHRLENDGVVALRGRWYEQCVVAPGHRAAQST